MAKKHWILTATVAAGLAVGAPAAMAAAPLPELPAAPGLPALPGGPGSQPNGGVCTEEPGTAEAQSDAPALQLPVAGATHGSHGNCQSAGNDQGNGAGGGMTFPSGLPQ